VLTKETSTFGNVILLKEDGQDIANITHMYAPLLMVLDQFQGTKLDLTEPNEVIVQGATAGCRRAIKRIYGKHVQVFRENKTIYLGGFRNDSI